MPRKLRVEFPGALCHIMSRGDRRQPSFQDDVDRQDFLKTLAEACQKTGFKVHAYCLMRNHFHLVVETPDANLVAGMRWLLSAYTIRFNHRHNLTGHVFSGRYNALIVEGGGSGYLKTVCDSVHLNPVRARLLGTEERLLSYPWSSLVWYLAAAKHRPRWWVRVERLLGEHGISADTAAGRQELEERMEARRRQEEDEAEWEPVRRGWCLGGTAFRKEMLERMEKDLGEYHAGELRRESAALRAERIIAEELGREGWTEAVWLWDLADDRLAAALKTLDFHHARDHLWAIAHLLHGQDTPEARAWVEPLLKSLRTGSEARVVQRLEQLLAPPQERPAATQAELEREVRYFQTHRDHLHYQAMEDAGAPRGSGAAESLGKQLQQRLRGCGQAWGRPGLTHLLRVCVLVKNRDDPLLWN